jgi:peptide/nickel transport system substrate-binding protein
MRRRGVKAVAFAAAAALALTACGGDDPDPTTDPTDGTTDPGPTDPGEEIVITYAAEQEFASYNNGTADQNAFRNTLVLNGVLQLLAVRPQRVRRAGRGPRHLRTDQRGPADRRVRHQRRTRCGPTVSPIDCADMLLAWAANSGYYMTGEQDEDGNDIPLFSTAGTTGFEDWAKPDCATGQDPDRRLRQHLRDLGSDQRRHRARAHRRGAGRSDQGRVGSTRSATTTSTRCATPPSSTTPAGS